MNACYKTRRNIIGEVPIPCADQTRPLATPIVVLTNSLLEFQGDDILFPRGNMLPSHSFTSLFKFSSLINQRVLNTSPFVLRADFFLAADHYVWDSWTPQHTPTENTILSISHSCPTDSSTQHVLWTFVFHLSFMLREQAHGILMNKLFFSPLLPLLLKTHKDDKSWAYFSKLQEK
jgi:hypothetical protein